MPTWGGQSTQEEMCHNWMIVYPKLTELWRCAAAPPVEVTNKFFEDAAEMGIWNGTDWYPYDKTGQFNLNSDEAIQFYNNWLTQSERQTLCQTINIGEAYSTPESRDNFEEYPQEDLGSCATEAKEESDLWIWLTVSAVILVIILIIIFGIYWRRKKRMADNYKQMAESELPENGTQKEKEYGATTKA
eukprot:776077_1